MDTPIWVAFGSALAGAFAGAVGSAFGSYRLARWRLTHETRVRLFDRDIGAAQTLVQRWHYHSQRGYLDQEFREALQAVEQVRRAARIAGKKDWQQVQRWDDAYSTLRDLGEQTDRLGAAAPGTVDPAERQRVVQDTVKQTSTVLGGLSGYSEWLEDRLN